MSKRSTANGASRRNTYPLSSTAAPRPAHGRVAIVAVALATALCAPLPAHAVDGCLVLLCLAAPSWRQIPQCVPPIEQLHRDLARGKPFPTCKTAGAGNTTNHTWASAPANCPRQYTRVFERESGYDYSCDYSGAITVTVDGAMFTRTWWSTSGGTVTEFSPAAKAQLGRWDPRFDNDFSAWLARQPKPPVSDPI